MYFIAEDIHLIAYIQCNIEKKCVMWHGVENYKNGHKSAKKFHAIQKHVGDNNQFKILSTHKLNIYKN